MTTPGDVTQTDRLTELESELLTANSITDAQRAELLDITRQAFAAGDPHRGFAALWMAEADWGDPDVPARMWAPSGVNPLVSGLRFHVKVEDLALPTIIEDFQVIMVEVRKQLRNQCKSVNIRTQHGVCTSVIPNVWAAWARSLDPDISEKMLSWQRQNLAHRCGQFLRVATWCPQLASVLSWEHYQCRLPLASKHTGKKERATAACLLNVFRENIGKYDWGKWLPLVNYLMERGVEPAHFEVWFRLNHDRLKDFTDGYGSPNYAAWFDMLPTAKEAKRTWLQAQINDLTSQLADLSRDGD